MWAAGLCVVLAAADGQLDRVLARVSGEAEAFAGRAPMMVTQETLRQKVRRGPARFRPRVGVAPVAYLTREIVSEYGWSRFKDSPNWLHEFRQVITVDGRQVRSHEKARTTLTMGINSEDDRVKKRMLEEYARYSLADVGTDFGQLILLFARRGLANYAFQPIGAGRIGADQTLQYAFEQKAGQEALTIFQRRQMIRQNLRGSLWVRERDGVPLRVVLESVRQEGKVKIRDEAVVDYMMSAHGALVPVSVVQRQLQDGELMVENRFEYGPFRKFAATSDIKFGVDPSANTPPVLPKKP